MFPDSFVPNLSEFKTIINDGRIGSKANLMEYKAKACQKATPQVFVSRGNREGLT